MNTALLTLDDLSRQLDACQQGQLGVAQLSRQWREAATALPLPPRYSEVLGNLLDRLEAGALFAEESCSFSQKDLLDGLRAWADKARQTLNS